MPIIAAMLAGAMAVVGLWLSPATAAEAPRVVVTLKPIHSLVSGVMAGVAEPDLLVPGGGSPHAYALRPSQARSLAAARVVVRVSANLETFLDRTIRTLADDSLVVTLEETPGLTLHGVREGGVWDDHGHAGEAHEGSHGHGHGEEAHAGDGGASKDDHAVHEHGKHEHGAHEHDSHIWLDPANAQAIVAHLAAELSGVWPEHAAAFAANAERMSRRLAALNGELETATASLRDKPYIVFHDAYRYLEERYGLHPAGSITVSPDRPPGAKRLLEIRKRIKAAGAACVFAEPQFEPKLVTTLTEGTGARRGVLDPLGAALPDGPELYFRLMRGLAADLAACLSPPQ